MAMSAASLRKILAALEAEEEAEKANAGNKLTLESNSQKLIRSALATSARLRKIVAAVEAEEEAEKAANSGYKFKSHGNNNTNYGGVNNNSGAYSVHGNSTSTSNKYGGPVVNNSGQFHGDGNGGVFYGDFNASKNYY